MPKFPVKAQKVRPRDPTAPYAEVVRGEHLFTTIGRVHREGRDCTFEPVPRCQNRWRVFAGPAFEGESAKQNIPIW